VPFEGESIGEVLMKHLTAEADVSRLAEPYRTVVARALSKSPDVRFHSVGEMAALLPRSEAAQAHHYAHPQPRSIPRSFPRPAHHADTIGHGHTPSIPVATDVDPNFFENEPVARAVRNAVAHIKHVYRSATDPGTTARTVLNVVLIVMAIFTAHIWVSLLLAGCFAYVVYVGVRAIVLSFMHPVTSHRRRSNAPPQTPTPPAVAPLATPSQTTPVVEPNKLAATLPGEKQHNRWRPRVKATPVLHLGTPRERTTELVGSLILSGIVALVVSLVMVVIRGGSEPNQYVWLAFSAIAGAWAVLIPGKLWEGREGDPIVRRFVFLVLGLLVGAVSYGLYDGLLVRLSNDVDWDLNRTRRNFEQLYSADGSPMLMAFMTYFGFLYLVPRWWRQTEPLRRARLSLFFTAVVGFWSLVLHQFWWFPQPWGVMLAVTISIAVQFSGRWVAPSDRTIKPVTA
jgi:hypothetical protein